ncbi:MAG: hypothetical protein QXF12_04375 [Candidatus Aenigmatarchaeota archaeon]
MYQEVQYGCYTIGLGNLPLPDSKDPEYFIGVLNLNYSESEYDTYILPLQFNELDYNTYVLPLPDCNNIQ